MKKQIQNFKQCFSFLGFFFFAITLTAQGDNKDFKVSDITGTYIGYQQTVLGKKDMTIQWKVVLNNKMDFSLWAKDGDLWLEQVQTKSTRKKFYTKKGNVYYEFNASDKKDIKSFSISILSERYKKLSNCNGLFIIVGVEGGNLMFDMNREGGNPIIPNLDNNLSTGEKEKKLHQQMTTLFSELEKGFNLSNGTREIGYTSYPSKLHIEGITNRNMVDVYDNGSVHLYANILSSKNSNYTELENITNIENALKSYSNSSGFQVLALAEDKNYVIKKSGKTIGFIEIKKDDTYWYFYLHKPLDTEKLKADLVKGVKILEKNFEDIRGEKLDEFTFIGTSYKSTHVFYGANSSKIISYEGDNTWSSYFNYYPYAALAYQFEKMNLSFANAKKTGGIQNDRGLFYSFEKPGLAFEISMYNEKKHSTSLSISKKTDPNEVKKENEKIKQYIDNAIWNTKGFFNSHEHIVELLKKQPPSQFEFEHLMDDILHKYMGLGAGTKAAIKEIEKAITEAKNVGCPETQEHLEKIKHKLALAKDEFLSAEANTREQMLGLSPNEDNKYGKASNKHANKAFDNFQEAERSMNSLKRNSHCYKTTKNNNNNTNTPTYVEPTKTYNANDNYPAFSGSYEGDNLYQLLGRHWDDPAIKNWLNNSKNGFEKSSGCDSEFCIYDAAGIYLTFSKSHLIQIELFENDSPSFGTFKGKLPKGIRFGAAASSINSIPVSWRQESKHYKECKEKGMTTMVYFDHINQSKITSVRIRKEITVDAKEDLENENVGVGLMFSVSNSGKISVNNTHTGFAAKKAGIREGMWILEIDGKKVKGKDEYDINKMLNGKKGTTVKVKFCRRYQEENAKEYLLVRGADGKAEFIGKSNFSKNYPDFSGGYEGDNLFQLLNRDFNDPAITKLINANTIKKINIGTDPKRKKMNGNGVGLEFYNNILVRISLSSYSFKGQLPKGLKFGMSPYKTKISSGLKWTDYGESYIYTDYNEQMELRADFDANSDEEDAKLLFVYLKTKPKKAPKKPTPKTTTTTQPKQTDNTLVGLGFTYGKGKDSEVYEVNWLTKSSAAYKAGIRRDDNIISINGTPITGKSLDDVKKLMKGKKGTSATVIVERDTKKIEYIIIR